MHETSYQESIICENDETCGSGWGEPILAC